MFKYNNQITKNQYMFIIQNSMIGVGILSLASEVCKEAQQSGWISTFLGGFYPIFVVTLTTIIFKNMNFNEFFEINRRIYGKFLAYIFTIFFFINFTFFTSFVLSGFTNVLTFSTTKFLSPYVIIVLTSVLIYFTINQGLTNIGRLSELLFYLTILLLIIPIYFINKGNSTNLLPIISNTNSIIKAIPKTFFSYSGVEISLFIIPFVTDTKNVLASGIKGSLITIILYSVTVILTISYCGYVLTSKLQYPLLYLVSAADLPILSNFEPLFIFLWGNKIFQTLAVGCFGMSYTLSFIIKNSYNRCCLFTCLLIIFTSSILIPEHNRSMVIDIVMPYLVYTIIIYTLLTFILSYLKRGEIFEKN
ncbi:spore germination protein (amino acid permease) [Caloramator fervidus]|uniref:Spore germination protein (Amino acid permease) n=1 Tax=Caloramator fervidus TaxID=29344 RepID=A0A1H5SPW4_9CLOT|nr:GerAB/ArcD/ProY family transporter [Caloramator fervidus]SEF52636.1 spore germination protein (amino acid permease) [Caloramator fervidus]